MKTKIILMLMLAFATAAGAQHFSEKITKELTFEKPGNNALMIFNISGHVKVVGYAGDKVLVEVERIINAKTERRLEIGKADLHLGIMDRADTIMLYVEGLCNQFGRKKGNGNGNRESNYWGYQWDNKHQNCQEEFDHRMNFTIRVPAGIDLYASTINDGDINVENVTGRVYTSNINGSIALKNISGQTNATTINGGVDLEYAGNPPKECRYYSLNGDINALFRKGLAADLSFESFNGDLYTNVPDLESLPTLLEKIPVEEGIKFKVSGNHFKIGKGGVLLDFETFNGNVYLKERAN